MIARRRRRWLGRCLREGCVQRGETARGVEKVTEPEFPSVEKFDEFATGRGTDCVEEGCVLREGQTVSGGAAIEGEYEPQYGAVVDGVLGEKESGGSVGAGAGRW